eukprot:GHVR01098581.1.p1 GENE.GHVR01098581.1~~GHVR01098581.1.p1  ORF type:complete len:118 (+),score=9.83 GHVR01098581.1:528-881(+)
MHFYNLPFPIRDYVNDCKSILDSSSRVVMGLIEMAKEKKCFDVVQATIFIQQALYQGFSCNIPFITFDLWRKISAMWEGLAGIVEKLHESSKSEEDIIYFLAKNVIEYDSYKKVKIM